MSGQTWFGELKKSAGKDWRKWVNGIRGEDISKVEDFNRRLAEVITYYKLYELDTASN
jgi:4-alpha-glucanotransferase